MMNHISKNRSKFIKGRTLLNYIASIKNILHGAYKTAVILYDKMIKRLTNAIMQSFLFAYTASLS